MLSFHSISFLSLFAFCTCYFHLLTRYIFSSRAIYFISSGLSFCPRLVLELLSFIRALVRKRGHIVAHNVPRAAQTGKRFFADTKCVWTKSETPFCVPDKKKIFPNKCFTGKRGNICVGNNVFATMCPRLPGPLLGLVKERATVTLLIISAVFPYF